MIRALAIASLVALTQCIGVAPFEAGEADDVDVRDDTIVADTGAGDTAVADSFVPVDTEVADTVDGEDGGDVADGGDAEETEVVVCTPSCPGVCGPDGCGGSCGACENGLACSPERVCVDPATLVGNQCEAPINVEALPLEASGDTRFGTDTFATSGLSCDGVEPIGSVGGGFADQVYRFVPTDTGTWVIRVAPEFDAVVTVLSSCVTGATLTACMRGADAGGAGEEEVVALRLNGGVPAWVVVDGGAAAGEVEGVAGEGPYTIDVSGPCFPDCSGRICGDDGCAGSCGECASGTVCDDGGQCVAPLGDRCGLPFVIDATSLPFSWSGTTATPDATPTFGTSLDCGPNGFVVGQASPDQVFAFTPVVSGVYTVRLEAAFDALLSVRAGCSEDDVTCLGVDGEIDGDETVRVYLEAGSDYTVVVDGFGNSVAERGAYTLTVDAPCQRSCGERVCGEDGCGLTCGECPEGACAPAGTCVAAQTLPGNQCETAFVVGPVPFAGAGNTLYASDAMALPAAACGASYPDLGIGTPDQIWRFQVPASGTYRFELDATFYGALWILRDCGAAADAACLGVAAGDTHGAISLALAEGDQVRIVVDGTSAAVTPLRGPYVLRISDACTPSCEGRDCGPDGCGGECGTCGEGLACNAAEGQCVGATEVVGNRCENPLPITAVPAHRAGTTVGRTADYSVPAGACPGIEGAWGEAAGDTVYAFTPPAAGSYVVTLDADFDSLLYVVRDCADVAASCVAGDDVFGIGSESVTLTVEDVSPLFIVVDGYSNLGPVSGAFELFVEAL
ncbi:MAG: hypothetical protein EP329_05550 [Deltaproteobacteria bacterium]|nr:MAG: hypothetical protein EP329_05550 [Deltaproteobacteria bacterium]